MKGITPVIGFCQKQDAGVGCRFLSAAYCAAGFKGGTQPTAGLLYSGLLDFLPCSIPKKQDHLLGGPVFLEQGTGIEPASEAWEATIIADILTLQQQGYYTRGIWEIQPLFVGVSLAIAALK